MVMTSLASQLAALRPSASQAAHSDAGGLKQRPSLLFSPSEAADLDADAIHSIGLSGLAELEKNDPSLHKYEKLLFSRSATDFRRENQSIEVLKSLNQSIRGLLKALTPYFLLRPSLKVLEFLVRTYSVQEHNVDDLLMCALPYHSTPQFVRLVHLIEPKGRWLFLKGVKKTGAPLSRTVLAGQCAADRAVLTFVCDLAKEPGAPRVSLGLFVGTCVELLTTTRKVPDDMTLAIFPVLLEGLRSADATNLQASAYMVLATLVKKVTLAPEVLKTVTEIIPKYANRANPLPSLLLLVAVCHYQRPAALPAPALQAVLRMRELASMLAQVAKEADASHLLGLLMPLLVRQAATEKKSLADLRAIIADVPLDLELVERMAREITHTCRQLHATKERGLSSPREHPGVQQLGQVLCEIGNRYPQHMDAFISGQLSGGKGGKGGTSSAGAEDDEASSDSEESSSDEEEGESAPARFKGAQREWLMRFLSKTFHGTRHCPVEEGGTTLLLALEHPALAVRVAALERLSQTVNAQAPPAFLAQALLRRIEDDEPAVALAALSWDKLITVVPTEPLLRALSATADAEGGKRQWANASQGAALQEQALRVLATSLLEQRPELADDVAKVLLRHLMVYPKSRRRNMLALKLAASVAHPVFGGLSGIWKEWKAARSEAADSSTPRGRDKDAKKSKGNAKPAAKNAKDDEILWDLNLRVVGAMSSNIVSAKGEARAGMLALLGASGSRLVQALVLSKAVERLNGHDQLVAAESLCAVLEASTADAAASLAQRASEKKGKVDRMDEDDVGLSSQMLDKLFACEAVTDGDSWHTLHLSLWKLVLAHLEPSKLSLDFAGQPAAKASEKEQRELALLRRLFRAFTSSSSVADYSAHVKQMLTRLGAEAVMPFLSWFVRDMQRANEHTRAHALYIGASILQGKTKNTATRTEALGRVAQALPSVLAALHDADARVRHAAVTWLRAAAALGKEEGGGKIKWGSEPLLNMVAAADVVQFLSALVSCSDELLSDPSHLPVFFGRALMLEKPDADAMEEDSSLAKAMSQTGKESMQELLVRQTVQLRTEDMMAQVLLLEGLHHATRPAVALPLAQDLLSSLAALSFSDKDKAHGAEAGKEGGAAAAKHGLRLRLVRIAVRLSYGHGVDAALASAGKKAPKLMAPLMDSIHKEAEEAAERHQAHAEDGGGAAAATRGGKDRTSRGVWLETLIKTLTPSLFAALDDKACQQLFTDLFTIAGKSQPNLSKAARERLRRLPLSLQHLEALFASLCTQLEEANGVEQKAGKRGKSKAGGAGDQGGSTAAPRAVAETLIVLDVLQAHQDPAHALGLMPHLFKLLAAVNESRADTLGAEDGDESLVQSLLGAILALLQAPGDKAAAGGKGSKKDAKEGVDMQALVICIRSAVSPQTRHEALNCLVELARSQPKAVLKHVMAVFAFLGESALMHDDQYSFHVIEHTIKSVIPPLVENGMQPMALLRVFVDALPSIPVHRRLRLFSTLLMLFEDDNIVEVFLMLVLAKAGAGKGSGAGRAAGTHETETIAFATAIVGQFALEKQLATAMLVLESIAAMPTSAKGLKACEDSAFAAAAGSVEELQRLQLRLVHVLSGSLGGRAFAGLLQALPVSEEESAQDTLLLLFEKVLVLQQRISQDVQGETAELDLTAMDAKSVAEAPLVVQLGRRLDELQQLVGRHLSVSGFVGTIETLLTRKDGYVQQRALQCLIHKLQLLDSGLGFQFQAMFLKLMPQLGKLAATSSKGGKEAKRTALVVQLSLCSIEHLARLFGGLARNQQALDDVVDAVVAALQHDSASVTTSACSCAAAMVWHSSTMMIDHVNSMVPALVGVLESALGPAAELTSPRRSKADEAGVLDSEAELRAQGAILALDRIVSKIPMLITPQVAKILRLLLHPAAVGAQGDSDVADAARQARHNLVTLVAPRVMVPALERACKEALSGGSSSIVEASAVALMDLVEFLCARLVEKDVSLYYMQLFRLLLEALDVRYAMLSPAAMSAGKGGRGARTPASAHAVETAVLKALEALVLKLNENRFKPLFLKMVEWASARDDTATALAAKGGKGKTAATAEDSEQQLHVMCRQVVLCRVIEALGQRLKAIMVPYFSYVMQFLLLMLSSRRALFHPLPLLFSASGAAAPEKSGKKRGRPAESDNGMPDPCKQLGEEGVEWAVAALHTCFLYDTLGFVTKERFEAVHTPLINLIEDSHDDAEAFSKRVDAYLKPAIVQLAVAVQGSTGSTMLWKPLNHQLLMRTRHDSPMVRFAALQITKALVERLGEEYLMLVPETLPFVVEVLEDMDEEVEAAARSLVAVLETLLGESLNEYLTQ